MPWHHIQVAYYNTQLLKGNDIPMQQRHLLILGSPLQCTFKSWINLREFTTCFIMLQMSKHWSRCSLLFAFTTRVTIFKMRVSDPYSPLLSSPLSYRSSSTDPLTQLMFPLFGIGDPPDLGIRIVWLLWSEGCFNPFDGVVWKYWFWVPLEAWLFSTVSGKER